MRNVDNPWVRDVPAVFRALADPRLHSLVPRPTNGPLEQACAHWGALHYTLSTMLGWTDTGRGLAWWYAAGKPVDDSRVLALVRRVWGLDDLIDYYAAWSWLPAGACYLLPQSADPSGRPSPTWLAKNSRWADERWWRTFVRRGWEHHFDPFYGGTDVLHLRAHAGPPSTEPSVESLVKIIPEQRRVVLVTAGLDHWLADLCHLEAQLPPLGDRSWRAEVFDRMTGYLGEYRRSRVTGRWFTGQHHIHVQGFAKL